MDIELEPELKFPTDSIIKQSMTVYRTSDDQFFASFEGVISVSDLRPLLRAAEKQLRINLAKYQTNPENRVSRTLFANSEPPSVKGE